MDWHGHARTPVWTYTKQTLIERLQVTPDEERRITRLISTQEKRRRERETYRASHTGQSREEYEARAKERQSRVLALRQKGLSWRAISGGLGISVGEAHRLGKVFRVSATSTFTLPRSP